MTTSEREGYLIRTIVIILLAGCGAITPLPEPKADRAYVFAATNCTPCIKELPELQAKAPNANITVYMTDPGITQAKAQEFADKLGIKFKMGLDPQCRTEYKKHWSGCVLPAAVLFLGDKWVKKYQPGRVRIDDMVSLLMSREE